MGYLFAVSVIFIIIMAVLMLMTRKRLKVLNKQIKELIKENDVQKTAAKTADEDICFKTDKNLIITFANEALNRGLGFKKEALIGRPLIGTLLEDNEAVRSNIKSYTSRIIKKSEIVNNQLVIINSQGQKGLMLCHQRPILNEILECEGISFVCKNISEACELREKLDNLNNNDILTGILNQEAFLNHLEQDFNRAKRYNKDFALLVVELRDLCDFINKGISFERGDHLLKGIADLCRSKVKNKCPAGRFEKTKIGLILNNYTREKAGNLAKEIFSEAKTAIRKLGVDEYNAQMLIISYTERKGFNDTFDNMLERTKRHIKNAARRHQYGVMTSDNDKKQVPLPTKFQE